MCFGQTNTFNYGDTITLKGKVQLITYEMPTGNLYETYILLLDEYIKVKPNEDWEGHSMVNEVHINIMNDKIEQYKDQRIKLSGVLFHALTIHHRRDVCIKLETIEKINNKP